jgi:hypothetical protein
MTLTSSELLLQSRASKRTVTIEKVSPSGFCRRGKLDEMFVKTQLIRAEPALKRIVRSLRCQIPASPLGFLVLTGLFAISMWVAFTHGSSRLLSDYDGNYIRIVAALQFEWSTTSLSMGMNPYQALGNISFCNNFALSPCFWIAGFCNSDKQLAVTYLLVALELFLAIAAVGAAFQLPRSVTMMAAWLLPLLSLPVALYKRSLLFSYAMLIPHYFEMIAACVIVIALFRTTGRLSMKATLASVAAQHLLLFWLAACGPALILPCALPLAIAYIALLIGTDSRTEFRAKILTCLSLVVLGSFTFIPFLAGNFLYSVPAHFAEEFGAVGRYPLIFVSGLFADKTFGRMGPYLIGLGFVGGLLALRCGPKPVRLLGAIPVGALMFNLSFFLVIRFWYQTYHGPILLYFEMACYPFYCLTLAYLVHRGILFFRAVGLRIGSRAAGRIVNRSAQSADGLTIRPTAPLETGPLAAAVVQRRPIATFFRRSDLWIAIACSALTITAVLNYGSNAPNLLFPPKNSVLVHHLQEQIGLSPGRPYNGMVATFTGFADHPDGVNFFQTVGKDYHYYGQVGNDFRGPGLWHHRIPTLWEYNQFMTPPYYLMMSRMLARPQDHQMRNVIVLSKINQPYLQSLGVRFLLCDQRIDHPAARQWTDPKLGDALILYELSDPNVGNYSPTDLIVCENFTRAISIMQDLQFDFRKSAIVDALPAGQLVPADDGRITFEKGFIRVTAVSRESSVLLLPLQFSHCLSVKTNRRDERGREPELIRMNVMQAGLVFSGSIEVEIRFSAGPFDHPFGRIRDHLDFHKHYRPKRD